MKHIATAIAVLATVLLALPVSAAAPGEEIDAGFAVSAVLPENQTDPTAGYFDLLVQPGQEQELAVNIQNPNDYPITVQVEAIAASTNRNGLILYSTPGIYDASMRHSFADLARVEQEEITVEPYSTRQAIIRLTMPEEEFDGLVLGAVRILRLPTELELEENGVLNQFSYVIAVRLQETDKIFQPDFQLGEAGVELVNYKAALYVHIRNIQPVMVRGMDVEVQVLQDGEPVIEKSLGDVEMAPNSIFPFTLTDQQGYGFAPGDYTARVLLTYGESVWELERDFTVGAGQAQAVNSDALNQRQRQSNRDTGRTIIALAAAGLVLAAQVVLLYRRKRKQ